MLISYSSNTGSATTNNVNASVVGVMIAEIISTATTACRRYRLITSAVSSPTLPKSPHTTGSSATKPIIRLIISSVSTYDCSVSILVTSSLTL